MDEAMGVFEEFFNMPAEDKAIYYSVDPNKICKLYTSTYNYANEKVHYRRDNLTHSYASPTEDCINFWPEKPTRYPWLLVSPCNLIFFVFLFYFYFYMSVYNTVKLSLEELSCGFWWIKIFREAVGAYTKEVEELVFKILDMICQGLGLQQGYFEDELSKINLLISELLTLDGPTRV